MLQLNGAAYPMYQEKREAAPNKTIQNNIKFVTENSALSSPNVLFHFLEHVLNLI